MNQYFNSDTKKGELSSNNAIRPKSGISVSRNLRIVHFLAEEHVKTRSKSDLQKHIQSHPTCQTCKLSFATDGDLEEHIPTHDSITCSVCKVDVLVTGMERHMENHYMTEN